MILAIRYQERDYAKTIECLHREGVPTVYVDRDPEGVGSLAEAINRGMKLIPDTERFVWIITNIRFSPGTYSALHRVMRSYPHLAAVCPSYLSDHAFLRPEKNSLEVVEGIPFVEFTCPMVRVDLMKQFPLDEDMPYVGHDLDWSHRVKSEMSMMLASLKSTYINHTYIRNSHKEPITRERLALRKAADQSTIAKLISKYGENWTDLMQYHKGLAVK